MKEEKFYEYEELSEAYYKCKRCGKSDSSIKFAFFPYVVSILVLSFRRAWSGVFCEECRKKEMLKAKLISLLLGWWGIPWGVIWTIKVLFFESNEGIIPEPNFPYLILSQISDKQIYEEYLKNK